MNVCAILECKSEVYARTWCTKHYRRWQKHGDPMQVLHLRGVGTPEQRFWMKVDKSGSCWLWTAGKNRKGYGLFKPSHGENTAAHRYSYMLAHGPISEGLYLDHICRQPACVNPAHLREVTPAQNAQHQDGHSDSKSGHRGVAWHSKSGKWQAKVTKKGKTYSAGLFDDVEEAAEAARLLRLQVFTHNELDRRRSA